MEIEVKTSMRLRDEVDRKRREISSDNISMSIGEILNLYRDDELDIHPEYQRVFRWQGEQKSRLVESVLLGIPLPPIYVAVNEKGVWEVVDGVQRLSTLFEFMGELNAPASDTDDSLVRKPELNLSATKHLHALDGMSFSKMDQALRLEFKRARLDVKVLAREGGVERGGLAKFDLFERLNTYGTALSPQELRNCILVSLNQDMFRWLKALAQDEAFRASTLLSDSQVAEKYDMDLALRFVTLRDVDPSRIGDVHDFLRDRMEEIALDKKFNFQQESTLFREVFSFLDGKSNSNALRPWVPESSQFRGGFSLGAFEGLCLALGRNWSRIKKVSGKFDLQGVLSAMWSSPQYRRGFSGLRARERMVRVVPVANQLVLNELDRISIPAKKTNKVAGKKTSVAKKVVKKAIKKSSK